MKNFEQCVKPGGLLLIDHRNYDYILKSGHTPSKCIYYNVSEKRLFYLLNYLKDSNTI
jgi:glycine N-methyltransferase